MVDFGPASPPKLGPGPSQTVPARTTLHQSAKLSPGDRCSTPQNKNIKSRSRSNPANKATLHAGLTHYLQRLSGYRRAALTLGDLLFIVCLVIFVRPTPKPQNAHEWALKVACEIDFEFDLHCLCIPDPTLGLPGPAAGPGGPTVVPSRHLFILLLYVTQ